METWTWFASVFGNKYALYVAVMGNLLSFFTGMSLAWSSPVLEKLNGTDNNPLGNPISDEEYGLVGSTFSIGGAIGPILSIYSLEILGRKYTMIIMAIMIPIFHLLLAFSESIYLYYISRIALGLAVGSSYNVVTIYISEIVSTKMRSVYICMGATVLGSGCVFSYAVGPGVSIFEFNLIIAILSFIYVPIFWISCPESLYYTMQKYGSGKTVVILEKLRKHKGIFEELEEIKTSVESEKRGHFLDVFKSKNGRRALMICTPLLISQQFSGINMIITYSQKIFEDADVTIPAELCTVVVSIFQTATSLIALPLAKRINLKTLLNVSFVGIAASCSLFGLYFYVDSMHELRWVPLVALLSLVFFVNCGVGSLPWVVLGELYPLNVKSVGTALTCTIYWIVQIILTYLFPLFDMGLSFLIFAAVSLLSTVFVQVFLIETRGLSLQEIQVKLGR